MPRYLGTVQCVPACSLDFSETLIWHLLWLGLLGCQGLGQSAPSLLVAARGGQCFLGLQPVQI